MELRPEDLGAHLARGLSPLYVIWGEEPLAMLEAEDAIRAAALKAGHERTVFIVQGKFDWSVIFGHADNFSLFAQKKLVEIRIPGGKPGIDGSAALGRYAASLPADTVSVVSLPGLEWKQTRSKWFEALAAHGAVIQCRDVPLEQMPAWIGRRLAANSQQAGREALEFLASRLEGNLLAARQEIDKLSLLLPPGRLSLEDVEQAVTDVSRFEAADIQDAMLAGDAGRCARILASLKQEGEAVPKILWQVAATLRLLYKLKSALRQGQPFSAAFKASRIRDKRQALLQAALKRVDDEKLEAALAHAARIDRQAKGLEGGDPWDDMLRLCMNLGMKTQY
ncbi:MAG: DNA polymerase III subunit delta [Pseudomonadota bacterium]